MIIINVDILLIAYKRDSVDNLQIQQIIYLDLFMSLVTFTFQDNFN